MTNQPAAAAFHPHLTHTVTLHLGNASLSGIETRFNTRIIPRQRGFSADAHPHHPTTREQSGLVAAVNAWLVLDRDVLRQLVEGLENEPVPVSTRLFQVLRPMTAEFVPDDQRFETLFDEVEYLFGVTYGINSAEGCGPVGLGALRTWPSAEPPARLATHYKDLWISHGIFESVEHFDACCATYNEQYRQAFFRR